MWKNREMLIVEDYRYDKYKFVNKINYYLESFDGDFADEFNTINRVLRNIGSESIVGKIDDNFSLVEAYFKLVNLKLTYLEGCNCVRLKLKTLLNKFGYVRKNKKLTNEIMECLEDLELVTYLKNYEVCHISRVKLDQMIMIRKNSGGIAMDNKKVGFVGKAQSVLLIISMIVVILKVSGIVEIPIEIINILFVTLLSFNTLRNYNTNRKIQMYVGLFLLVVFIGLLIL